MDSTIGVWIRRFLLEHLIGERNLAEATQASYRDTFVLLLPFASQLRGKPIEDLCVSDLSADVLRGFLEYLEANRGCSVTTRNQRLAAVHAFAHFVGSRCPEHLSWATGIRSIPFKRTTTAAIGYLEKPEIDAVLDAPDRSREQGKRDYALLLFLYNTGARASEAAGARIADLNLEDFPSARFLGKGKKVRYCPLWSLTVQTLRDVVAGREDQESVFLNRCGQPITRFGVYFVVQRSVEKASDKLASLRSKAVSVHWIRHTTAVHLLRSGVDINTIRAWLGHVSLDTTHVYAEVDLQMKQKALQHCEIVGKRQGKLWKGKPKLMEFLRAL